MASRPTIPFGDDHLDLTVRTLTVEVVEGPDAGKRVTPSSEKLTVGCADGNDLTLSDPTVSRFHLQLERTSEGIRVRDTASTNGTFAHGVRLHDAVVPLETVLRVGKSGLAIRDGEQALVQLYNHERLGGMCGSTPAMRRLMASVQRAAGTEVGVLVVGESGTGKELVARALHDQGARRGKPFVTVDCGALAPNLVASELFGHERGAFTSADRQHKGAFERANGGTIFLDEIGELPSELQPTLLGALERKRFRRVGGHDDIHVDVRVVAATHRDLRREVNTGTFRLDLYYRLAVVVLEVPPLRERPDDLKLLIGHFLKEAGEDRPIESIFSTSMLDSLRAHSWPGNVRELRNVVEATLAMGAEPVVERVMSDRPASDRPSGSGSNPPVAGPGFAKYLDSSYKDARAALLNEFEREYLTHWLARSEGNVAKAAREAKMDRSHLFELLRRHGLR